MRLSDLPDVKRISDIVHCNLTEADAVFAERLRMFPQGCFMTDDGYAVAHPAHLGVPPELDELSYVCPPDANALHVHDVALLPHKQGAGLGSAVHSMMLAVARRENLRHATLIAVAGKHSYWERHGYRHASAVRPASVSGYGVGAAYMARTLPE